MQKQRAFFEELTFIMESVMSKKEPLRFLDNRVSPRVHKQGVYIRLGFHPPCSHSRLFPFPGGLTPNS